MITRTDRNQTFDSQGNLIAEQVVEVDVTEEVITWDLHTKARQALVSNREFLQDATPTNAEVLAQVRSLTRQMNGLIRLLIGSDLLTESEDT